MPRSVKVMEQALNIPAPPPAQVQAISPEYDATQGSFRNYYYSNIGSFEDVDANFIKKASDYIKRNEGVRNRIYKDSRGNWTIGIGHLVTNDELPEFRNKTLTNEEILALFTKDIQNKLAIIRRHFPSYSTYSENLKIAILDGYFRGDLAGSPKTKALLNKGDFQAAAKEYLNNDEYRAALRTGSGVAARMQRNAQIFNAER